jgi:undecaprenyl-diphosphatase
MDVLLQLDTAVFHFINVTLANPLTDRVMPFVTNGEHWVLAVLLAALVLVHGQGRASVPVLLGVAVVFAACDQTSAHLLKPLVDRVRPCHVVPDVNLLVGCSSSRSFPSAHAANTFGLAVFLSWALPRWRWLFFSLCALVSLSRICVGVHYPSDVLGGFAVGAMASAAVIGLFKALRLGPAAGPGARPVRPAS